MKRPIIKALLLILACSILVDLAATLGLFSVQTQRADKAFDNIIHVDEAGALKNGVMTLAGDGKTTAAAKEVGDAIASIQKGTRASVEQADGAARTIEQTAGLAGTSGEALHEIVDLVGRTTDQMRTIAAAVEEQSATSTEINMSVESINDIAQRTAAGMDEASRDVEELRSLADQLREVIEGMVKQA